MRRLQQVLCIAVFLSLLIFSTSYAESFFPASISPEMQDSLRNTIEPSLQSILDGLGYDIDVENDKLPTEIWEVISGDYYEVMLAEVAGYSDQTASGWYVAGDPSDTTVIFTPENVPGDSAFFEITGCDSNGLFIAPFAGGTKCDYVYYTENALNPDGMDHAWVFCSGIRPNEFIIAWEDVIDNGDNDHNDLVLVYRLPNRPPLLTVPNDTSYSFCQPENICFDVSAYDLDYCGDSATVSKLEGPGTFEAGTCCFLPASTDSAYTFVFVATDVLGATDTDTVVITVDVNDPPQLTCPDDGTVEAGETFVSTDFSSADPDGGLLTVSLCGVTPTPTNAPSIVANHVEWQSDCADAGDVFTICLQVTDNCGAKDTCYFDVTANDIEPPVAQCPDDITRDNDQGLCSAVVSFSIDATDNCPGVTVAANPPSGSTFPVGTTPVEVIATDASGNADTCYFDVTVNDTEPPVAQCPGDITQDNDPGECDAVVSFSIDATDNCPGVTVVSNPVSGSTFSIGATPVEVIATDASGNADTCYFNVTVNESEPPVALCPDDVTVGNDPGDCGAVVPFTIDATDNCPGVTVVANPPSGSTFPVGTTPVEVIATDASGNADTCYFNVTINDTEPPVAQCPGDITRDNDQGLCSAVVSFSIDATDNCPGVTVAANPPSGSTFPVGTTPVEVIATDASGNADTCYFDVTVNDTEPPVADCPEDITQGVDLGECTAVVSFTIDATDNCPGEDVSSNPVSGSTFPLGTTTVEVIATDAAGNADTCYFDVTVTNQPPVITCPDDGSVHAGENFVSTDFSVSDPDDHSTTVTFLSISPTATNDPSVVSNHVEWVTTCAEEGDYLIQLVATDQCGAKDTCRFTVNVYNQPPDLTCPSDGSVDAGDLFTSEDYSVTDPDDATGVTVVIHDTSPTPVNSPGLVDNHVEWQATCTDFVNGPDFAITLIATDPCGAKDTCEFTVTVYNLPPEIVCPEDDSVHAGELFTSADFSVSDPKAEPVTVALCGVDPAPVNIPVIVGNHVQWQTDCADDGIFTICLEATDSCGAKDTCYFDVTVYNQRPLLVCPVDTAAHAGDMYVGEFSVSDPEGDSVEVSLLSSDPQPITPPVIVDHQIRWQTSCDDTWGDHTICLVATDSCGAKDTCCFMVTVYNQAPVLSCPPDDSARCLQDYTSGDFSVSDPDDQSGIAVSLLSVTPAPVDSPTIVDNHVEWFPTIADLHNGPDFTITLLATDPCGAADTCSFLVSLYHLELILTPPPDDSIHAGHYFLSQDFSVSWAKSPVTVSICGVFPLSVHTPTVVESHVELQTECDEAGMVYTICLAATDTCGSTDTGYFDLTVYNRPPDLTCPENGNVHAEDDFVSAGFSVTDPDGDPVTVGLCGVTPAPVNPAHIVGSHVEWQSDCEDVGKTFTICLEATDSCGAKDTCEFTVNVYNNPPQITCPDDGIVDQGDIFTSTDFSASDPDGDPTTVAFVSIIPPAAINPTIVGSHVEWITTTQEGGLYLITLRAVDPCSLFDECSFLVTVPIGGTDSCTNVLIPEIDCVNPGEYVCIPILLDNNTAPFGGFELEIEFDYTSMTFVSADPGQAIQGFEHFTYRLLPCPLCGCCKYKILLYGQYDLPNGVENVGTPIPVTPQGVYRELANLCFVINNNENLRGLMIPVCWEWEGTVENGILVEDWNCQENTFSSWSGDTLFTSNLLCQFRADLCDDASDRIQPELCFQRHICGDNCGGIPICDAGPGACKRGDINYNTITYEVADAVLFASYFVEGTSVFRYDLAYQICATDVNADGRTLTLSDLVYLIRVILHDAVEMPKVTPSSEVANVIVYNGTISTECAAQVGAILFEFDRAVSPTLLADMEMVNKGNKVLVWSSTGKSFTSAEVLTADAELVSVSAVDRDSRELTTTITAKVAPSTFALHPAYPNPFNPFVNLSFNLPEAMNYNLKIYNVAGQLVRSYSGVGSQNLNSVTWDGRDNKGDEVSSGIYFYKLTAAGFSATDKMVMMK